MDQAARVRIAHPLLPRVARYRAVQPSSAIGAILCCSFASMVALAMSWDRVAVIGTKTIS